MKRTLLVSLSLLTIAVTVLSACTPAGLSGGAGGGNDPDWDKSSVVVSGKCADNTAVFTVTNGGSAMQDSTTWRMYVNNVLTQSGSIALGEGETTTLSFTYAGQDVRLEVDQRPGHPGNSLPRETVNCGTPPEPPTEPPAPEKITICHATGSATNPYVEITVSKNAADGSLKDDTGVDHQGHAEDIIPAPAGGCPTPTKPPEDKKITICHATGSATNPYVEITVSINTATGLHGHEGHPDDIIPAPATGCPEPEEKKITICHATGSATNPYVEMTVSINAATGLHGHEGHPDDIIPMPATGCPKPEEKKITICHATGSATNPYVEMTVSINAATGLHGHEGHADDIIPMPATGCPQPEEIKICHATGNDAVPYELVTATVDAVTKMNGHEGHTGDIIPVPPEGCPTAKPETITLCHATGSELVPYIEMTVPVDLATKKHGHENHTGDIIPVPATGCPQPEVPPVPEPTVCPEYIIFHTFRDQNLEIYRLDGVEGADNAKLFNLTNSNAMDSRPTRSPDDSVIVFQSNRNGNVELYYTDASGSTQSRLTNTYSNNVNAMFGPDNKTVIYQSDRNGNWDIFTIDSTTGDEKQLTSNPYSDINPFYSPDLRWVVFQSNRNGNWDIFLLDAQTGNEYTLAATPANEVTPAWSPSGMQVSYLSDASGTWNLHIVDINGKNDTLIGSGTTTNATWSPEGYRIAYQSERDGNIDVYSYDLNGKKEYRVTTYAGADSAPTWNCGGTLISFTSSENSNPDIFQVNWQGGTPSALTINPATDKWSEWTPSKETGSRGH